MNINHAVDKEWEGKDLSEIADAPISAIQGISEEGAKQIAEGLRIKNSLRSLAESKYVSWAQAIVALSKKEQ